MSVKEYLNKRDWRVKENASFSYSLQGLNSYIASEATKKHWLTYFSEEVVQANNNGFIYIHDLGIFGPYCGGHNLEDLLQHGFRGAKDKIHSAPPKRFSTALGQMNNLFFTLSGEFAGAQAFSNFDTLLAPYVWKDELSYEEVEQAMQEFIFALNIPTRIGFQQPFSNLTFDITVPEKYKNKKIIIAGEEYPKTYGEMQNYMDMINKAFCEVMVKGDARGAIFTFPIPTYNITKEFEWDKVPAEIWQMTAKFGTPYFCLAQETPVPTKRGMIPICEVKAGDHVLSNDGKYVEVKNVFQSKPSTKITINEEVVCSENHMLLTQDGCKKARELSLGDTIIDSGVGMVFENGMVLTLKSFDYFNIFAENGEKIENFFDIQLQKFVDIERKEPKVSNFYTNYAYQGNRFQTNLNKCVTIPKEIDEEIMEICGQLLGDGSISKGTSIRLTTADEESEDFFCKTVYNVFNLSSHVRKAGKSKTCKSIEVHSRILNDFLTKTIINSGNTYRKTVKECVFYMKDSMIGSLLRGLFDTDGTVSQDGCKVAITLNNEKLLRQVQMLLCVLGISSTIVLCGKNLLTITGESNIDCFAKKVSFRLTRKRERLENRKNKPTRSPVGNKIMTTEGAIEMVNPHYKYRGKTITRTMQKKENCVSLFLEEARQNKNIEIKKLEISDNNDKMFDLEIDTENHLFLIGEGIVSHNSNYVNSEMSASDSLAMCCRLKLNLADIRKRGNGLFSAHPNTGSIGVVTLNLPRIVHYHGLNFDAIKKYAELAKECLEIKRQVIEEQTENGLYPYAQHLLRHAKDCSNTYWGNHFSTIGIIGMHEALLEAGKQGGIVNHMSTAEAVLEYIQKLTIDFQKTTGHLYNLEATPAEGCTYTLAKKDKKCGIITSGNKEPYYTNSVHFPVGHEIDMFDMIKQQENIQSMFTGGTVLHLFLGEAIQDPMVVKKLVQRITSESKIPYFSITPTFSVCPEHGYISGEHFNCPYCDAESDVYTRIVGYFRPVKNWNKGKEEEYFERKVYKLGGAE